MDIEQLKIILETVSTVSGDAATIAISYIVFDTVIPFIGWMVFLFLVYKVAVKIIDGIPLVSEDDFLQKCVIF